VAIVPGELDGVLTDTLGGDGLGGGLEHRQRSRRGLWRLARPASCLGALILTHGAGACLAKINEAVMRDVAVAPLDVNAGSGREINLYRLGIDGRGRGLERGLHEFSIACRDSRCRLAEAVESPVKSMFYPATSESFWE
jgi:hypothetical protein